MNYVVWDDVAIEDLLTDPAGPVGQLIFDLSTQAAAVATATVRVRDPGTRDRHLRAGRNSTARAPGVTKASIRVHGPVRGAVSVYGGVNADADPSIFLEMPADQMTRKYPFLTLGLDSLVV